MQNPEPDSKFLAELITKANRHFRAGRLETALNHYDRVINIKTPLCRHRRAFIAAAHLGRAAVFLRHNSVQQVDEDMREASMIYAMDGDETMALQVARLSDLYQQIIHHDPMLENFVQTQIAVELWMEPSRETFQLLLNAVLDLIEPTRAKSLLVLDGEEA